MIPFHATHVAVAKRIARYKEKGVRNNLGTKKSANVHTYTEKN